jgi:hypothetical protein
MSKRKFLLPGDIIEAVQLATAEINGSRRLTYGEYRQIAKALVQIDTELRAIRREVCPALSQGHVTAGDDPQCRICHAYLRRNDP